MYPGLERFRNALYDRRFNGPALRRHPDVEYYIDMGAPFVSDEVRIDNSMALKRLEGKAQVFPEPQNPHIRNRISHTREAKSVALVMSSFLGLNNELCRAIMLGHDIGHAPFGHGGEKYIPQLEGDGREFEHQVFGVVVAQSIEDPRWGGTNPGEIPYSAVPRGLNLTLPTLEGILYHSTNTSEMAVPKNLPQEYALCMYADKLAYIFADVNDAKRLGKLSLDELKGQLNIFDFETMSHEQLQTMSMVALIKESAEYGKISFKESPIAREFAGLRNFLYGNVYEKIVWDQQRMEMEKVYEFLQQDPRFEQVDPIILLSLLADNQVHGLASILRRQEKITDCELWKMGITELIPFTRRNRGLDYSSPDLNPEDFKYP